VHGSLKLLWLRGASVTLDSSGGKEAERKERKKGRRRRTKVNAWGFLLAFFLLPLAADANAAASVFQ
jgi:hypothetical protein